MAKKVSNSESSLDIFTLVSKVDNSAEILSESKSAVIKDYIDTGSYILNAAISGSLFKGIIVPRITCIAGERSAGKSYLSLSICRNAQKKGYTPIYLDSENAIDIDFVKRLGCDPSNFIIKQVTTISETSTFIANVCKEIEGVEESKRPKVLFVIDSLGNLTSDKELNDTLEANGKADMTKAKDVKALFRTNTTAMGKIGASCVVVSHVYKTLDLYAKNVVSGGSGIAFAASSTIMLSASKLDDKESDKEAEKRTGDYMKTGVMVTAKMDKSRFTIPQVVKFSIPFFKAPNPYIGLEKYLTWENSGIMRGKLLTQKEYDKLPESDKSTCQPMKDNSGNDCYAYPKLTSNKIVVKHLGEEVPISEMFTPKVFTDELLHKLDEEVIRPLFELPTQFAEDDINEYTQIDNGNGE